MEYNTTKEKITVKEYGRHVQAMVDYLLTIEDKNLRNHQAKAVIRPIIGKNYGIIYLSYQIFN